MAVTKRTLSFDFTQPVAARPAPAEAEAKPQAAEPEGPRIFTVGELDRSLKRLLEKQYEEAVWVEGEVVGARPASSGHLYFTLKDEREDASLDVAMYKTSITPRARALITDGARIRLRGKPTFWPPRGRLQFIADRADAVGKGALLEALEKLKAKLSAEGLFAQEKKRPLPREPRIIGVVTSSGGAVIHDICKVAFRRGGARILLAPALVQGATAAASILRALATLERVADVDVIIVGRGGGSTDDLSAFNDEALVRAVAACRVPVISAVGHEVDVTLTDFAADARAATPSQAAEMIVPDDRARRATLGQVSGSLARAIRARIVEDRVHLAMVAKRVGDPRLAIASFQQSLDERLARLEAAQGVAVRRERDRVTKLAQRLAFVHPRNVIAREEAVLRKLETRLDGLSRAALERRASKLASLGARLDAMSPLKVLGRGYAIATNAEGRAVRVASDVTPGARITVRVHDARITADVVAVDETPS